MSDKLATTVLRLLRSGQTDLAIKVSRYNRWEDARETLVAKLMEIVDQFDNLGEAELEVALRLLCDLHVTAPARVRGQDQQLVQLPAEPLEREAPPEPRSARIPAPKQGASRRPAILPMRSMPYEDSDADEPEIPDLTVRLDAGDRYDPPIEYEPPSQTMLPVAEDEDSYEADLLPPVEPRASTGLRSMGSISQKAVAVDPRHEKLAKKLTDAGRPELASLAQRGVIDGILALNPPAALLSEITALVTKKKR